MFKFILLVIIVAVVLFYFQIDLRTIIDKIVLMF